jgi:Bacterial Ig-like domain
MLTALRIARWRFRIGPLVTMGLAGCASAQAPPGGPPDFAPPVIDSTIPDSGAVKPGWRGAAIIQFDEVIDERSGGGLEKLVTLSPVPKALQVDWKRSAIAIKPKDGWRDSVTYLLTLQPGIADLTGNRMTQGRTLIFSTGGPIPDTRISGTVVDWEQGRLAPRAMVEAVRLPDSLRYVTTADSASNFNLPALPPGRYLVRAGLDANNDHALEPREPFDSLTVQLDSVASHTFWTFQHDTVGPALTRATVLDSVTLRLELNAALPPESLAAGAVRVLALPDSTPVTLANVWHSAQYDSVAAAEHAAQAAKARDTTGAKAGADTTHRAPPPAPLRPPTPTAAAGLQSDTAQARLAADTARVNALLRQRPKISSALVVRLAAPLTPGGHYLVETDVVNLLGARRSSHQAVAVPEQAKK